MDGNRNLDAAEWEFVTLVAQNVYHHTKLKSLKHKSEFSPASVFALSRRTKALKGTCLK